MEPFIGMPAAQKASSEPAPLLANGAFYAQLNGFVLLFLFTRRMDQRYSRLDDRE